MPSSASLPPSDVVRIHGYYCTKKEGFSKARRYLDDREFIFTVREFKLSAVEPVIFEESYYFGSLLNPIPVVPFVDIFGSPVPFFVKKDSARKLRLLLSGFAGARSVNRV